MKTKKRAEVPIGGIAWHALPLEAVISLHVTNIVTGTAISMLADPRSPHIHSHSFVGVLPVKHLPQKKFA